MGDVKTNMKPSKPTNKGIFAKIQNRLKKNPIDNRPPEERFADQLEKIFSHIEELIGKPDKIESDPDALFIRQKLKSLSDRLDTLIAIKQGDLASEKGMEEENRLKLVNLNVMGAYIRRSQEIARSIHEDKALITEKLYQIQFHLEGVIHEAIQYENS